MADLTQLIEQIKRLVEKREPHNFPYIEVRDYSNTTST